MPFFKPKWMCKNEARALQFVENLTDRNLLASAAMESPHEKVRKTAVSKTADPSILAKIATRDVSAEVREIAALRVQDQTVLAEIAKNDTSAAVRGAAIAGLTDEEVLCHIALTDPSTVYHNTSDGGRVIYHLRLNAVHKISNQKLLFDIACTSDAACVSVTAAECLTNQNYLMKIVLQYIKNCPEKQDECASLCCRAALQNKHLTEQRLFAGIIASTCPTWMKCCAVQRLTDQKALNLLAQKDETTAETTQFKGRYYPIREEAQRRLLQLRHS